MKSFLKKQADKASALAKEHAEKASVLAKESTSKAVAFTDKTVNKINDNEKLKGAFNKVGNTF